MILTSTRMYPEHVEFLSTHCAQLRTAFKRDIPRHVVLSFLIGRLSSSPDLQKELEEHLARTYTSASKCAMRP